MVATHYRWDFVGLSTDEKPTADNPKVTNGSTFYESDTSKYYIWYNNQWYEKVANGGGSTEPTSSETKITSFDNTTKTITGSGFGEQGENSRVYLLLRDYNDYTYLDVASWKDNEIKLTEPIDLSTIEGTTTINIVTNDGIWSNKWLIEGELEVEEYGKIYIQRKTNNSPVETVTLMSSSDITLLNGGTNYYSRKITIQNVEFYRDEVVGFQYGKKANPNSVGGYFLAYMVNLNQPIKLPSTITTDYGNFMYLCTNFNSIVDLGGLTALGNSFLPYCNNYNQPINLKKVTTIGQSFLVSGRKFNNEIINLENVTSVGNSFLNDCISFNQDIDLSNATSVGSYFLANSYNFDSSIKLDKITTVNSYFLRNCYKYDKPLTFVEGITLIDGNFMSNCYSFNSNIILPSTLVTINTNFMNGCRSFNKPLDLSNVTTIGNYFMCNCDSYNQYTGLENVETIGNSFMTGNLSLNNNIRIGSSLTSIGTAFLQDCYSLNEVDINSSVSPTDNSSLSVNRNDCKAYLVGVTLIGNGATTWKTNLSDRSSSPYRKLIDGTL